jgi:molybdate transport system ATP-binding protein
MIDLHVVRAQGEFTVQAGFRRRGNGVTALFGPSGAGKTSIVNMVAGLLQPDEGHIVINQRCLYDRSRRILRISRAGHPLPILFKPSEN